LRPGSESPLTRLQHRGAFISKYALRKLILKSTSLPPVESAHPFDLGLFRSVQIVPTDRNAFSEGSDELDFTVEVREHKAGNVLFGPGWTLADGWRYSVEASYRNIGGVGRQIVGQGSLSEEVHQRRHFK